MPRRDSVQEAIGRLDALDEPRSAGGRAKLKEALREEPGLVVKRAAAIVADSRIEGFADDLERAFYRLSERGADRDPSCYGKIAVASALLKLSLPCEDLLLAATRYRQLEPSYGGPIDTAAELRAMGIVALAESGSPKMLDGAVHLLLDPEVRVRIGAVRALVTDGSRAAVLLLRYKTLEGDSEAEVVDECLRGLAERDRESLPILASFIPREDEVARAAVLAIGESHLSGALECLRDALDGVRQEALEQAILLAIAMIRSEEALDFLLGQVREGGRYRVEMALAALGIYAGDRQLEARISEAREARDNDRRGLSTRPGRRARR